MNLYLLPNVQRAQEWVGWISDRIQRGHQRAPCKCAPRFAHSGFADRASQVRNRKRNAERSRRAARCYQRNHCCALKPRNQPRLDMLPARVTGLKRSIAKVAYLPSLGARDCAKLNTTIARGQYILIQVVTPKGKRPFRKKRGTNFHSPRAPSECRRELPCAGTPCPMPGITNRTVGDTRLN